MRRSVGDIETYCYSNVSAVLSFSNDDDFMPYKTSGSNLYVKTSEFSVHVFDIDENKRIYVFVVKRVHQIVDY